MPDADDHSIIRSVLSGSQGAFARLVDRYQPMVLTLVRRNVQNRAIAEELAQDVFLKAYRYLPTFRGESKFSTWLYTITHTTCISYLRIKKPPTVSPGDQKVTYLSDQSQGLHDPGQRMDARYRQRLIEDAINSLGAEDREVITLFYQCGLKVDEVASVMQMSAANVKVRLFRSRQVLKEKLKSEIKEFR